MHRNVEIGKNVEGKELEEILMKVAEKIGLKAISIDEKETKYRLGSVRKEEVYTNTIIKLRGRVLPIAEISGIKRGQGRSWFSIKTGLNVTTSPYFGFGSEELIEKYLSSVSECL